MEQADWDAPDREGWVTTIGAAIAATERPVVLVAHSLGCVAVALAAARLPRNAVRGAFLVAPADVERPDMPRDGLARLRPCADGAPALPVDADREPQRSLLQLRARADDIAADWGSLLVDAGESGHINVASGHGPWPEGLTRFATLMARI